MLSQKGSRPFVSIPNKSAITTNSCSSLTILICLLAICFSCQSQAPTTGPLQVDVEQWRQYYPDWQLQQEKTFSVSSNMDLAMAWHILYTQSGHTWHWHNGGTGGYRTSLTIDPENQVGGLVFTNVSAGHPAANLVDQLNYALLRNLLEEYSSMTYRDKKSPADYSRRA